jgi:DNA-binding PadR family transcriptional regulator
MAPDATTAMDVKTLCLGVIAERPASGYEIKKLFDRAFRHFFAAGFGSIYPALAELAQAGLVTVESVDQERRPDKKVYRITAAGLDQLTTDLAAAEPRHKVRSEFLALLYFAHLLPPDRVAAVLDGMVAQWSQLLAEELAEDDAALTPGQRFARGYGRSVLTAARAYVQEQGPDLLRSIERDHAAGSCLGRAAE